LSTSSAGHRVSSASNRHLLLGVLIRKKLTFSGTVVPE
jgi:hypothetical protein